MEKKKKKSVSIIINIIINTITIIIIGLNILMTTKEFHGNKILTQIH